MLLQYCVRRQVLLKSFIIQRNEVEHTKLEREILAS
eukprot:SAG11_NODE_19267_length_470_cov_1.660377_2_plen_35_part_01